jgi:nitrogen regulatory protein PII
MPPFQTRALNLREAFTLAKRLSLQHNFRALPDAVGATCQTGHIGDGKIFVTRVEQVTRIRTSESGADAV